MTAYDIQAEGPADSLKEESQVPNTTCKQQTLRGPKDGGLIRWGPTPYSTSLHREIIRENWECAISFTQNFMD